VAGEGINTSSEIKAVTVYRNYADIHRECTVSFPAGSSEIVLEGLSASIDYRSLQVTVPKSVILLSAAQQHNFLVEKKKTTRIIMVEDSIEAMNMRWYLLANAIQALSDEEAMILANKGIGGANVGVDPEKIKALSLFYQARLPQLKNERTKLTTVQQKLTERIQTFKSELEELNRNLNKPTGEIVLQVRADRAVTGTISFSYLINSAYWTPAYDLRVEDIGQPLQLLYKAHVTQNSGIDWKDVKLTMNTGNPSLGLDQPKLAAWYINFGTQGYFAGGEEKNSYAVGNMARAEAGAADDFMSSVDQFTTVASNQLNVSFKIDLPYNIPSDGRAHVVAMKEEQLPARYTHHTVPKLDETAFLMAKITDWQSLNLLPGPANVFFEGTYVGQTQLYPATTNDTMLVSLGRDQNVMVSCILLKDVTKTKTFGANKTQTFGYRVTVKNTKSVPIEIEVLKNVPIAMNDDIKVEIINMEGAAYTPELGKLLWTLTIPPGQQKSVELVFSVKYPKNQMIPNL
jgi:uncharacterized protein (TIGR02231 family)